MQDVQAALSVGMLIRERYQVKRLLGKSQFGAVYLVIDQGAKRPEEQIFALKEIIGLSEQERYQLTFDSISLRNIHHEGVPHIHHVFNDDKRSRVCIVMEYVEGPDLESIRQDYPEQRLTWPEVAEIMAPIVDVVSFLHCQEPPIVHGDIKPANILYNEREERFMLVDIGVPREEQAGANVSLAVSAYKVTAQSGNAVDVRADVYGFAATCYTMLTGSVPPNVSIRAAHFEQAKVDLLRPANLVVPSFPSHVARAIQRAMSLQPVDRFSSIEEFWRALQIQPKELTPKIRNGFLPILPSTPGVTEQREVLANVQKQDSPQRVINTGGSFSHKGRAVLLLLLIFFLLVGAGTSSWLLAQSHHTPSPVDLHSGSTPLAFTTPVRGSTAPIVTPTSSPGNYPEVVGSYAGTLADLPAHVSATMILQGIHQIGRTLNGYLTVGPPFEISSPFDGTIDFSKHFQFTVNNAAGHPILFLEGAIQSATSISGDFYQCTSNSSQEGTCLRASDGYGIWSALLVTSNG